MKLYISQVFCQKVSLLISELLHMKGHNCNENISRCTKIDYRRESFQCLRVVPCLRVIYHDCTYTNSVSYGLIVCYQPTPTGQPVISIKQT